MSKVFFSALLMVVFSTTLIACSSTTYKRGVDYEEFPADVIPIYDEAIVYNFFGDDESCGIEYGSEAKVNDVIEFYQDEFSDTKYTILNEEEKSDMYEFEGYVENISFYVEIEKPQGSKTEFYTTIANISVEEYNQSIIEEREVNAEDQADSSTVQDLLSEEILSEEIELESNIRVGNTDSKWNFSTSSYLVPNNPTNGPYDVSQLCDDSLSTCWIPGNNRNGVNELITLSLDNGRMANVKRLLIFGGYGKSNQAYYCNLRVKRITIFIDGVEVGVYSLEDIQEYQTITLPQDTLGKKIDIRINDYYPSSSYEGHKAWNDLCISEIKVFGKVLE